MRRAYGAGERYGHLETLRVVPRPSEDSQGTYLECQCACGVVTVVRGKDLRSGNTISCGCVRRAMLAAGLPSFKGQRGCEIVVTQ